MGTWATQLPNIQDSYNISDGLFGIVLLCLYFGIVFATPIVGSLMRRFGSRITVTSGAFLYCLTLPLIGMKLDVPFLAFTMLIFGLSQGILDVSMNAQGVLAEIVAGIPILGSFHGSYSIAAALGSLLGSGLTALDLNAFYVFLIASCFCIVFVPFAAYVIYNRQEEADIIAKSNNISHDDQTEGTFMIPKGPVIYLCATGFLSSFGEGGIVTWSTIYFKRVLHADSPYSSAGFFAFMIFMGTGK